MDNKQKIFIGIGILVFVVVVGFIAHAFMSKPSLDEQSKDKSSENKPALETNVDNKSNEKNVEDEKAEKQQEKTDAKAKNGKKKATNNKSKKEEEPKKKPDKKDLKDKSKQFVEIQNKSKTPDNVKSLKSDMESIGTKKLVDKVFSDHMSADEESNFKAKVTNVKVVKDGKKNAETNVKYDLYGKSSESKDQEKLREDIEETVYFKYEDDQYKVDRYKQ